MAYPLKKLFHMDRAKYEEEYLKGSTLRTPFILILR